MLPTAPTAALTSATNVWSVFYKELFEAALNGEEIAPDWAKGYDDGAVSLTVGSETLRFEKPEIALVRLRCDF